jgi:hypothetical protein
MADEKCDYCKLIKGKYCCFADERISSIIKEDWAEFYSSCESNFYRGCDFYLNEIKSTINQAKIQEDYYTFSWGDDYDGDL